MTEHPNPETAAILADAKARLKELRAVAETLRPDRDDPQVLSELVTIESAIRAAEAALR
jgi:hypothetical protein